MVLARIRRYFQGRFTNAPDTLPSPVVREIGASIGHDESSAKDNSTEGHQIVGNNTSSVEASGDGSDPASSKASHSGWSAMSDTGRDKANGDRPSQQPEFPISQGQPLASSQNLNQTQKLDADTLETEISVAQSLYENQKWPQVIAQCRSILTIDASHAPTYKLMGTALLRLGQKDKARAAYERALEHDPGFADVYVNLGNLDAKDERWDEAIRHYQQAIALKPDFAGAYRNLARVWTHKGNERLATECLFHAIEREPDSLDGQGYFDLGGQLLTQGQAKQAIHCYRYVLEKMETMSAANGRSSDSEQLSIDLPILHQKLAEALTQTEQWQEAVNHYRQAQQHEPSSISLTSVVPGMLNSTVANGNGLSVHNSAVLSDTSIGENGHFTAIVHSPIPSNELIPLHGPSQDQNRTQTAHQGDGLTLPPSMAKASMAKASMAKASMAESSMEAISKSTRFDKAQGLAKQGKWGQVLDILQQEVEGVEPELNQRYELLAKALRMEGNLDGAMEHYKKMLMLYPNQAKPFANLGSLYAQQEQWKQAKAAYAQAIQLDPDFAGAYRNLARVWESTGNEESAADCWVKAYELEPGWGDAAAHLALGQMLVSQGKGDAAIASFKRAIAKDDTLTSAYFQLAKLHHERGNDELAMIHYGKALQSDPDQRDANHCDAIYGLGQVLAKQGDVQRAIACFQKMIQLVPADVRGYQGLRDSLVATNNLAQAIPCYEKLAQLQPDSSEAYHEWGDALNQLERWQEAVPAFQRSIQLNSEFSWSYNNLGDALLQLGLWQDAAEAFNRAIALNPDHFWSHHNLGTILLELEDWHTAIYHLQQAIALNSQFAWTHYSLGVAFATLNQWHQAIAAYRQAQSLDETLGPIRGKLIEALQKLIQQTPRDIQLYQVLAEEYIQEGQTEEAIATYQMVLHIAPNHQLSLQALAKLVEPLDPYRSRTLLDQAQQPQSIEPISITDLEQFQDVAKAKALLARTNLFDSHYYQTVYGISGYEQGLEHYLKTGIALGYNPNPLFDTTYYTQQYLQPQSSQRIAKATNTSDQTGVRADEITLAPLVHYYAVGHRQNCDPHPFFSQQFYLRESPNVVEAGLCPLDHYLTFGAKEGRLSFSVDSLKGLMAEEMASDAPYLKGLNLLKENTSSSPSKITIQSFGIYCSSVGNYFMNDIADYIAAVLTQIGHDVVMLDESDEPPKNLDFTIIVAPHEFFYLGEGVHRASDVQWWSKSIMVNLEQPQTAWFSKAFHFLRRSRLIWDINVKAAALLHRLKLPAYWLPLGYVERYEPLTAGATLPDSLPLKHLDAQIRQTCPDLFAPLLTRPIDLYFVGILNERREEFLIKNGSWLHQYNCFLHIPLKGDPLNCAQEDTLKTDELVGISRRSKILLNVHRGELPYFEWHRIIFYGLWQNTLVVTENCHSIPGLLPNVHFVSCSLDEMGPKISWLLSTPEGRRESERIRWAGHRAFKEHYSGIDIMQNIVNRLFRL